jgi:hypothetical protein
MTTLNAHFDGRVFVPDEPVDLPVGKPVKVFLPGSEEAASNAQPQDELPFDIHPLTGLPVFRVPPGAKPITMDDIREAEDEI